jgi:hypothetical protein
LRIRSTTTRNKVRNSTTFILESKSITAAVDHFISSCLCRSTTLRYAKMAFAMIYDIKNVSLLIGTKCPDGHNFCDVCLLTCLLMRLDVWLEQMQHSSCNRHSFGILKGRVVLRQYARVVLDPAH